MLDAPLSIAAAQAAFRRGSLTPLELLGDCLARVARFEPHAAAWVVLDAEAALEAAERLPAPGDRRPGEQPLLGIPLGIKDLVDVAGWPTRAGSKLTDAQPAARDATVVARLRAAGAILLGKTVTTEFACFDPPPTKNPWNAACTPGGSSSGSAAATALGMCAAAIGSQTGGSITRPASYCGVAGWKPTFAAVSRAGVLPVSRHLDHVGVLARTAADCAIVGRVIYGADPRDPASAGAPESIAQSKAAWPPRLGVMRRYFFETAEAETAALSERALAELAAAGATVVELPLIESFERAHAAHRRIMCGEAARYHRETFGAPRPGYGPSMAALVAEGLAVTDAELATALSHQVAFTAATNRALAEVDALLVPATPAPAPADLTTTGDPRFNSPWSYAGVPTFSFPCGLTHGGLPIALQLVGPQWSDWRLAEVAAWCEATLAFEALPPLFGE